MKIYFLAGSNDGCGYYRAFLPCKFLNSVFTTARINIDWFHLPEGSPPPEQAQRNFKSLIDFAESADILVLQRQVSPAVLKLLAEKRWLKKFVYDNDDLMFDVHPDNPTSLIPRNKEIIDLIVQGSHMVTTTTMYLKREYEKLNEHVTVLPNSLDFEMYPEALANDGNLRILLSGSVLFKENSKPFYKVLKRITEEYPKVTFVLQGLAPKSELEAQRKQFPDAVDKMMKQYYTWDSLPQENLEYHPHMPMMLYPAYVSRLKVDMCLIPRTDDNFNKAKSNVKFLEMAAMKIPVIAQEYEGTPYDINNGETGYLAKETDEWLEAIKNVLAHKEKIKKEAYGYCTENYDIRKNIQLWKDAYSSLL